ncbi:MAG: alpha/beta hydrolase [Thiohalocapsa sp.]|nr:alpha/beta hydrolase [Thiohalocapsa sp.]MCF7991425.1 alpha/beta hydrolase [Thiohalocapsa sp.]
MPGERFAAALDARLAVAATKDVYIYVHGYKVDYENPVLVAGELWHFLGNDGAFIAYRSTATCSAAICSMGRCACPRH